MKRHLFLRFFKCDETRRHRNVAAVLAYARKASRNESYSIPYKALCALCVRSDAARTRLGVKAPEQLDARGFNGLTAFLVACTKGHSECITVLVNGGCDTAAMDNGGATALHECTACVE